MGYGKVALVDRLPLQPLLALIRLIVFLAMVGGLYAASSVLAMNS